MVNEKDDTIEDFEEEPHSEGALTKRKKTLFIMVPLVVAILAAAIYAATHFINKRTAPAPEAKKSESKDQVIQGEYYFINMNDIIVTLASTEEKRSFLKLTLSLQVKDKSTSELLNSKLPIISDSFQIFLREVRPADLSGSAGVLLLKNELLKRVNKIIAPNEVMDVLFKEILLS